MDIIGYGAKIVTTSNTRRTVEHTGIGILSVYYMVKRDHGYSLLVCVMLMPIKKGLYN